ncbi:hypothetical protein GCM10007940_23080 [Portibacter lacus]|uniref:VCBS repeat-containing protein n=1 Tax=Portibacter lacus TaxID=1099794 RepID=A0AA37SMV7_9BACT|nr:hypothetical protein GCM10007940_23080 [Portibacter lacus]
MDKKTWKESVLPNMGWRLGIKDEEHDPFTKLAAEEVSIIMQMNVYPEQALISSKDWKSIVKFYIKNAPDSLTSDMESIASDVSAPFRAQLINIGDKQVPQVSLLEFDVASKTLYIGDYKILYALNTFGQVTGTWGLQKPLSHLIMDEGQPYIVGIGSIIPSDLENGYLAPLSSPEEINPNKIVGPLPRPVHADISDLNNDGKKDALISSFGNHKGKLAWYDDFNEEKVISSFPGTRRTEVVDMDGDGDLDVVALRSQAWEALSIYYNDGKGIFTEDKVLSFSPVHGVSYFELVDFNKDGNLDVLLTNGDNWDLSQIDKPYHGVRVYLNNGENKFEESYFFPMKGCHKAMSADFDKDGDQDIVAISFFDALDHPRESIVYLENKGDSNFTPRYLDGTYSGKWLTMDIGDFNQDGYPDVFLGSYFHNFSEFSKALYKGGQDFPQLLMLLNTNK